MKDTLRDICLRVQKSNTLTKSDYTKLREIIQEIVKSTPSFYMKDRDVDTFKEIVVQSLTKFYNRLISDDNALYSPNAYLAKIVYSVITELDKDLDNILYLKGRKLVKKQIALLRDKDRVSINENTIANTEEKLLHPYEDRIIEKCYQTILTFQSDCFPVAGKFTEQVKEELDELIIKTLESIDGCVPLSDFITMLCERLGYLKQFWIPDEQLSERNLKLCAEKTFEDALSPNDKAHISIELEKHIERIRKKSEKLPAFYAKLCYFRIAQNMTLNEIALEMGWNSPNNTDYYLRKFQIEETYNSMLAKLAGPFLGSGNLRDVLHHIVDLYSESLEQLYETIAGEENGT